VTAQRLEKWLEAAVTRQRTIGPSMSTSLTPDARSICRRGRARKTDFDLLDRMPCDHAVEPREHAARCHQWNP
jgi:hypothetical protein